MWPPLTPHREVEVERPVTFHWEGHPYRKGSRDGSEVSKVIWVQVLHIFQPLHQSLASGCTTTTAFRLGGVESDSGNGKDAAATKLDTW